MSTFLDHLGSDLLSFFNIGEKVAAAAAPFVSIASPSIGAMLTSTLSAVTTAQALGQAAAASGSTDTQKLAAVVSAITPTVTQTLVNLGVPASKVDSPTVTAYTNAFVALLNTLPAPEASATTTAATSTATTTTSAATAATDTTLQNASLSQLQAAQAAIAAQIANMTPAAATPAAAPTTAPVAHVSTPVTTAAEAPAKKESFLGELFHHEPKTSGAATVAATSPTAVAK